MQLTRLVIYLVAVSWILSLAALAENKYVGVKTCAMCHKAEKQGNQLGAWELSKHAQAFTVLTSPRADSIAKARGLATAAAASKECLQCHVSAYAADANLADKNFSYKDGVQCETCHGAGSGYKTIQTMKEKGKAIAAGLRAFKDEGEIEKFCRTCHNEKSPVYKGFNFKERWEKIKHPRPKT